MAVYSGMAVPTKQAAAGALPVDRNAGGEVYVAGTGRSARISDAGAAAAGQAAQQAAAGLGSIGKGIGKFSDLALQIKEKNDAIDMAKAQEAYARLQMEGVEEWERLSKLQGEAAIGADGKPDAEAQWKSWFEDAKKRYGAGLGKRGAWYFNTHSDAYGVDGASRAAAHVDREVGAYQDKQLAFAIDAEGKAMAADSTGASWEASLGRLHALNEQRARRLGWSAEMLAQANRDIDAKAIAAAIGVPLSIGQLDQAQALVGRFGKLLSPEDFAKLQHQFSAQTMAIAVQKANMGDTEGVRALAGGGGPGGAALNAGIAAASARRKGNKWVMGGSSEDGKPGDCANHVRNLIGHAAPGLQHLFQGTAADIYGKLAAAAGASFVGEPQIMMNLRDGQPMALFVDGRAHANGRLNGIGHVAIAFQREDGSWVVSEALRKGSTEVPIKAFMNREGKHTIYGVPIPQAPGMGKGPVLQRSFGLLPQDQLHIQSLQMKSEAGNLAASLMQQMRDGTLSEADLYRQAAAIKDPHVRAAVRREIADMRAIDRIEEQEATEKANQAVGARIEELFSLLQQNPKEGIQTFWLETKKARTEADAHPEDKRLQAKARQMEGAYRHVTGGRSLATDPGAFDSIMRGIEDGTVRSEADMQKSEAYNTMSPGDKRTLKQALKASKKVDIREARDVFRSTVGNPDTQTDSNRKKALLAQEKAYISDVVRMAEELNLGGNVEWYKKLAARHASRTVTPGLWNTSSTYAKDRLDPKKRDETFPEASTEDMANAGAALGSMPESFAREYIHIARKWKEKHASWASDEEVAKLVWHRSQKEAELREGRSPSRPEGVPESAEWVRDEVLGWGWKFVSGNSVMFRPYVYEPKERQE